MCVFVLPGFKKNVIQSQFYLFFIIYLPVILQLINLSLCLAFSALFGDQMIDKFVLIIRY